MGASQHYQVAVIGAGFSGSMVAVNLARLAPHLSVALIERNKVAGQGLAYGTGDPDHLLNVRAGQMGAFADEPEHFWRWLEKNPDSACVLGISAQDFVPRMVFGKYLKGILADACAANPQLAVLPRHIVDLRRRPDKIFELHAKDGQVITADRVVLALGNFPPDQLAGNADATNPYAPATWREMAADGDVLIVGTGLTSLDLIVTLAKTKSTGTIHLLSRHGLLPREHAEPQTHRLKLAPPYPTTALGLYRAVRREIAAAPDVPWQSVIDALRPLNQLFWQSLNIDEQRRFLRHVRAYWDVHRHRCAPKVMDAYRALEQQGRIVLHQGSIVTQTFSDNAWDVVWRPRGKSALENFSVRHIIRCTGPQADFRKLDDLLVQNLFRRNLIAADGLRLGLEVSKSYDLCDAAGNKIEGLYALGGLLKGLLYESIAVPELRGQAADIARRIARDISV